MSLQTSGHKNARWGGYPRTGMVQECGAVRYYLLAHYPGVIEATPRLENLEEEESLNCRSLPLRERHETLQCQRY